MHLELAMMFTCEMSPAEEKISPQTLKDFRTEKHMGNVNSEFDDFICRQFCLPLINLKTDLIWRCIFHGLKLNAK